MSIYGFARAVWGRFTDWVDHVPPWEINVSSDQTAELRDLMRNSTPLSGNIHIHRDGKPHPFPVRLAYRLWHIRWLRWTFLLGLAFGGGWALVERFWGPLRALPDFREPGGPLALAVLSAGLLGAFLGLGVGSRLWRPRKPKFKSRWARETEFERMRRQVFELAWKGMGLPRHFFSREKPASRATAEAASPINYLGGNTDNWYLSHLSGKPIEVGFVGGQSMPQLLLQDNPLVKFPT